MHLRRLEIVTELSDLANELEGGFDDLWRNARYSDRFMSCEVTPGNHQVRLQAEVTLSLDMAMEAMMNDSDEWSPVARIIDEFGNSDRGLLHRVEDDTIVSIYSTAP